MTTDFLSKTKLGFSSRATNASVHTPSVKTRVQDAQESLEGEGKVKTKLLSMWNNVKYDFSWPEHVVPDYHAKVTVSRKEGWTVKTKTNFSKDSPVWLLGKCYHRKISSQDDVSSLSDMERAKEGDGIEGFKIDFSSRIWLTYRREFPILNGSNFTTDCGWGCMLRSGQMLVAQALICHLLGRDWRFHPDREVQTQTEFKAMIHHRNIIKWFGDSPSHNSPLSIHMLVMLGEEAGKRPGDWYGPNSVAHVLRRAVEKGGQQTAELARLAVYVAQDCAVYMQDVVELCHWGEAQGRAQSEVHGLPKALVVLVPMRLGVERMNSAYSHCLASLLSLPHCIGIIGGRPKHSLYFVGFQDDKLIHLDPHYCQPVVDVWQHDFPLATFHCHSPRKLALSKLDPSCCVGFYCRSLHDYMEFVENVKQHLIPSGDPTDYPIFVFCEGSSKDALVAPRTHVPEELHSSEASWDVENVLECDEFEIV